jgi:flavorubredoxin
MKSVRLVTEDLYWVGANDHRINLFENIHTLDGVGVSYNSYLLLDEKTVLFDTVDWTVCRQFLENVDFVLGGRKLDYLVVNHVEPDHAASIEEILIRYPDVVIISNKLAFKQIAQFGFAEIISGHTDEVSEGDTRNFGKHTIEFYTAPMVHWPEVMVTFDSINGVLFSADAFGTFKTLDGVLFADEVDFERDWLDETRRYLANIVGKYGSQVQALLKKIKVLMPKLKFICPLHGPVWRENFEYILGKYDTWSLYEPEVSGVLIVYASMYGNTESAAVALAAKLREKGVRNVCVRDVSNTHVSWLISETFKYSHVVLASVTYNFGIYPPLLEYLHDMKALNLQKRTFAIIQNGTWAPKAGEQIRSFIDDELKNMTILDPDAPLTITSSATEGTDAELTSLAETIAQSLVLGD